MNNKTPEEIKEIINKEVDELQKKIDSSPWKIYPDIPINKLFDEN